jgi:phosphoribosylformimino-5-aminoimidazole carboxamide ribonucleotide (ProFAR) isomerase
MGLALTNRTLDKYFGFLSRLDNRTKKKLIIKLAKSIEEKESVRINLRDLSGAWEDSRDSDEIIKDIRNSRVEKQNNIDF